MIAVSNYWDFNLDSLSKEFNIGIQDFLLRKPLLKKSIEWIKFQCKHLNKFTDLNIRPTVHIFIFIYCSSILSYICFTNRLLMLEF